MNDRYSFLNAIHFEDIESLYQKYKDNPNLLESSWSAFFHGFDFGEKNYKWNNTSSQHLIHEKNNDNGGVVINYNDFIYKLKKEFSVFSLINTYRKVGHCFTNTNPIPIKKNKKKYHFLDLKDLNNFNLSDKDLDTLFEAGQLIGIGKTSLRNIINYLNNVYCHSIGIEYEYIVDYNKIKWIEKWFNQEKTILSVIDKKLILTKLHQALAFESFVHKKFIGQKRFSIEGNESVLPALEEILEYSSNKYHTESLMIGMPHRGRLNVLSNFLGKDYSHIFSEFQSKEYKDKYFSGDVKYHLGYHRMKKTRNGKYVDLYLVPNPSHLECVNPIVEGITRAKIDHHYKNDFNSNKIIPILIHGDAALSGQGIVYEVIQLSKLKGYTTGGTIHIIINNQIGFTTNCEEGRSSIHCTDIAKVILSPVLHVNSDDIESVIKSIRFAIDFRMRYHEDVFIDLVGYRKYGHNEGDEPRFTQPYLYNMISKHVDSYKEYKKKLENDNVIDTYDIIKMEKKYENILYKGYNESKNIEYSEQESFLEKKWKNFPIVYSNEDVMKEVDTKFSTENIKHISRKIFSLPKKKKFFKKTESIFNQRLEMIKKNSVDWSMAELLAYGTLLYEGVNIRLSGEDVGRGTFSQRHVIIKTEDKEEDIILLNKICINQGKIQVYNSPLSEYGVLGFDYGYAMYSPNVLTLWEAQFGDFGNGAQIIIDQYISSAEDKWKIRNGIVLLLPHGYEGQGPEHSSARIERYLQLCAKNNMFVVNCTTPANFYHLLRRQMKLKFRKPLIIFTPKSLLRNTKCISSINDLSHGSFKEILDDDSCHIDKITRLIFCSGKIYYDLLNKKQKIKDEKTALIRIEQIYPLKIEKIEYILEKYINKKDIFWVQEEPENMGAWSFILRKMSNITQLNLISPYESSSPSTGSYSNFLKIQNEILEKSFNQ
ncbi:2-oxoglutarate dehydrogenase E1 component [Blattabacterium cuenoti]|uniref:2-oxoglutarate dehydrogenase E1 component n=1 Tax=Blattabacterium cuenoti TaxID=1653831 RepID=UPI00163BCBD4|nr:2-oxoglutarate dehydrogenase E1 component [Blattabacterium cuenoti]